MATGFGVMANLNNLHPEILDIRYLLLIPVNTWCIQKNNNCNVQYSFSLQFLFVLEVFLIPIAYRRKQQCIFSYIQSTLLHYMIYLLVLIYFPLAMNIYVKLIGTNPVSPTYSCQIKVIMHTSHISKDLNN